MLRRKGVRVVSITEHADDSPTGKLHGGHHRERGRVSTAKILPQDVVRGMREAASRGFFLGLERPLRLQAKIKVSDGAKERPTLEVDPATAPVVKELFEKLAAEATASRRYASP